MAQPKTADGQIEALRLIKIARDTVVKARTAVNGQEILPVGGQQTCPPMVSRIAH
jgi:hypothetical protein